MPDFGECCSDFYVNQKLALKMDLPESREPLLDLFDRVRRSMPELDRLRRYDGELALESPDQERRYRWVAMRQTSIRSGDVNPSELEEAYALHRLILEVAPYYLSISPLDIDYLELVFGFDLEAEANRDEVVFDALLADGPLGNLVDPTQDRFLDCQPSVGLALNEACDLQAFFEVRSRGSATEAATGDFLPEPISVYLTVRRHGPVSSLEQLPAIFATLCGHAERLAEERAIPQLVMPIRHAILSRP
ncbi:MAG: hypothetical protein ACO38W_04635 [Phycisphaerales bacterium]